MLQGKLRGYNHLIMNFLNVQLDQEQLDVISTGPHLQLFYKNKPVKVFQDTFFLWTCFFALTMQTSAVFLFFKIGDRLSKEKQGFPTTNELGCEACASA